MKIKVLLQLLFILILVSCTQERVVYEKMSNEVSKEQYIVVFQEQLLLGEKKRDDLYVNSTMSSIESLLEIKRLKTFSKTIQGGVFNLSEQEVQLLKGLSEIKYIEKDNFVSINEVQLDPPYNLDRIDQDSLPLDGSYSVDMGASEVHAYVIDTGLRVSHIEFGDRSRSGFDFVDSDSNVDDCNGHGTHVAGTLAGSTYGVAKNIKVVGVRVLGCTGGGRFSDVISGIEWVTENHIKPAIANMSLGGGVSTSIDQAVQASISSGVTYVVAAGNSSRDACNFSPARVAEAITVGSTTRDDTLSSFTNYGECVDVFAPGSDILSAWIGSDGNTRRISGTSMASPLVAGVAAIYLSQNPQSTPQQVREALLNGAIADKLNGLRGQSPDLLISVQELLNNDGGSGDGEDVSDDNDLESGELIESLSGFRSQEDRYTVEVSELASKLTVTLAGGTGDADLYLKSEVEPSRFFYDCRPFKLGNEEVCEVVSPKAGTYHLMIRAYSDYKGTSLKVEIE